jgi:hypothetical protein
LHLRDPHALEADFFSLPAVQQSLSAEHGATDPKDAALARLLAATLSGDLKAYRAAATADAVAAVAGAGAGSAAADSAAVAALLEDKARLSALLALASARAPGGRVPFAEVRAALDVPSDADVQRWVAKACAKGVLDAKIDAVEGVVVVGRAAARTFGSDEWRRLAERLASWEARLAAAAGMVAQCTGDGGTRGGGAHIQLPAAVV